LQNATVVFLEYQLAKSMGITHRYCFGVENSTMTLWRRCQHTQYCLVVIVSPACRGVAIYVLITQLLALSNQLKKPETLGRNDYAGLVLCLK
jgi:hypothetical protein